MHHHTPMSPAARALAVAQRCAAEDVFTLVTDRLQSEPSVAFALSCGDEVAWSPELDIAVRMLSIARYGRPIDDGQLIWGLSERGSTHASVESGRRAVKECLAALNTSRQPFELLAHVHGDESLFCSQTSGQSPLEQLADALADEVRLVIR